MENNKTKEVNELDRFKGVDNLDANEWYRSNKIKCDDDLQLEFIAEKWDTEADEKGIYKDLLRVEEKLLGTENLTNHADKLDYTIAVGSGILCGMIDVFFVGEFSLDRGKEWGNKKVNSFVTKIAKMTGCKDCDLPKSIKHLEQFGLSSDSVTPKFGGGLQHHLRDFAHHPTIVGLCFSLLSQFTETAYGTSTEGTFKIERIEDKTFIGKTLPQKILYGVIYWFLHMVSDMAGSSGTVSKGKLGTGLPGPILSLLKELSALPIFSKPDKKDTNNEFSIWISKLFNGTLLAKHDENGKIIPGTEKPIDLRAEIGIIAYEGGRQALPVIINECIVRGFYLLRRLYTECKVNDVKSIRELKNINVNNIIPNKNRTIIRMLTISKGTFTAIDVADASIRAVIKSGGNLATFTTGFLLRINFVGLTSFAITGIIDIGMGIKKYRKEKYYDSPMNLELVRLYKKKSSGLTELFNQVPQAKEISGPLFLHFNEKKYQQNAIKIMFIGINNYVTQSYIDSRNTKKEILSLFEECKNYNFDEKDAFYEFASNLNNSLNGNNFFIWNSIYKFSKKNNELIMAENKYFNLLVEEIKICQPKAVIFMTGRKYDQQIREKFSKSVKFMKICHKSGKKKLPNLRKRTFAKIESDDNQLPRHIYRISSPHSIIFKLFKKKSTMNWLIYLLSGHMTDSANKKKNSKFFTNLFLKFVFPVLLLILLFLLIPKTCSSKKNVNVPIIENKTGLKKPLAIEEFILPYDQIHFMKDTRFFLSEGNKYTGALPDMTEGKYEDRLDNIANGINNIIKTKHNTIFYIKGFSANIPNHERSEYILSKQRTERVKEELIKRGIPEKNLKCFYMGSTDLWGDNTNETNRKGNRVVKIEIQNEKK